MFSLWKCLETDMRWHNPDLQSKLSCSGLLFFSFYIYISINIHEKLQCDELKSDVNLQNMSWKAR